MFFKVYRTSDMFSGNKPCENAILIKEVEKDYDREYKIEINTLEELLALEKSVKKPLIVSRRMPEYNEGLTHEIEIYDGYRE